MPAYRFQITDRAKAAAQALDFRALVDQACCPRVQQDPPRNYGGVFLGGGRETVHTDILKIRELCHQQGAIKPFVTGDLECGAGVMSRDLNYFQSQMALGAAHDEGLAYELGLATGKEGRAAGYDWTFSPCVDILTEVDNPITSVRTSGTSPASIIPAARGYLRGTQDAGLLATLKHFPGDGHTTHDQHLTTIHNPLSLEAWWEGPGRVYRELIEAGAKTVMPGHISLPAYDPAGYKSASPMPATLSARLKQDLLRGELGFGGLIVSDAMNMGGVANYGNYYEMCARFWESGGDLLLFPLMGERFYREMEALRDAGLLKVATLQDRVARLLSVKEHEGLLDGRSVPALDTAPGKALSKTLAAASVTLVRDRSSVLPLKPSAEGKVLHLVLDSQDVDPFNAPAAAKAFHQRLEAAFPAVELLDHDFHGSQIHEKVAGGEYAAVLVSVFTGPSYGNSTLRLRGTKSRAMMHGWMKLGVPVVFVLHRHPFTYTEFEEAMDCVIATYGSTPDAMDVVVEAITGRRALTGKLP